ncbi:hypothetical protein SUGI_0536530 [Cryptomeria japonica]|nr:hypothetical protein SUGI_0536530 [Cryptomeria japonica]
MSLESVVENNGHQKPKVNRQIIEDVHDVKHEDCLLASNHDDHFGEHVNHDNQKVALVLGDALLLQILGPGGNFLHDQPRERMDHTTSLRNRQHVTSIARDVGAPFTGASCSIEVGTSSRDPWTTEAQHHIPLASGSFDGASHVRLRPSVTFPASHVHTTTNIGTAMGLSQMQPSTLSFEA